MEGNFHGFKKLLSGMNYILVVSKMLKSKKIFHEAVQQCFAATCITNIFCHATEKVMFKT